MAKINKEEKKQYEVLKDKFLNVEESLLSSIWFFENFPSQMNQSMSVLLKSWQDFVLLLDVINGHNEQDETFDFTNLKKSVDEILKKALKPKYYTYFNDNVEKFISFKNCLYSNNEISNDSKVIFERFSSILSIALNFVINSIQKKYHQDFFSIFKRSLKWIVVVALLVLGYCYHKKSLYYETYDFTKWKPFDADWNVNVINQDYGSLRTNSSVDGNPCTIKDMVYKKCYGTHANSKIRIDFAPDFNTFEGACGADKECGGTVKCLITDKNGKELFRTDVMTNDKEAIKFNVSVKGLDSLYLITEDAGNGIACDHVDWVDLKLKK